MKGFGPDTFGSLYADEYDDLHNPGTTEASVDLIAELAGDVAMLELAIGTGRMALPLAGRGFDVSGLEASPEMVTKLREKPGGRTIPVMMSDMADFQTDQSYGFAFLVFNTLFNLTSQHAQIGCFGSVSKCLTPGGQFLVETFVPNLARFQDNRDVTVSKLDKNSVWLEAVTHDPVEQTLSYQRIRYTPDGVKIAPLVMRYAWPAEMDLMARLARLELKHRWGGWQREPFTAHSEMHVSVYEKIG
ncbi:MAG: class I SAM-dependent methyltransferase [Pseudomonadota bacterium]